MCACAQSHMLMRSAALWLNSGALQHCHRKDRLAQNKRGEIEIRPTSVRKRSNPRLHPAKFKLVPARPRIGGLPNPVEYCNALKLLAREGDTGSIEKPFRKCKQKRKAQQGKPEDCIARRCTPVHSRRHGGGGHTYVHLRTCKTWRSMLIQQQQRCN